SPAVLPAVSYREVRPSQRRGAKHDLGDHAMRLLLGTIVLLAFGSASAEAPHLDRYGDPLPPAAVARLGSLRLLCAADVANVVFTPDARTVAAVLRNGPSQYWEV